MLENGRSAVVEICNEDRRNAISLSMWRELDAIAIQLGKQENLRAVLVCGRGGMAFSAGADISEFDEIRSDADLARTYDDAVEAACGMVESIPVPVVASLGGICIGAGLSLAMACDIRICGQSCRLALPAVRLGLGYNHPGVRRLIRMVGDAAARDILFTGRRLSAKEALACGLVNQCCADEDLTNAATALIKTLVNNAPMALRALKYCIDDLRKPAAAQQPEACEAMFAACNASDDYREGKAAFKEKRSPKFLGR